MTPDTDASILYFAYGTLLGTEEMTSMCPSAKPLGHAELPDYEFLLERFGPEPNQGGCALQQIDGARTKGVLYKVPSNEWAHLRRVSGEHTDYKTIRVTVERDDNAAVSANTLTVKHPIGPFRPSEEYIGKIVDGALSAGLPKSYLARIVDLVKRARTVD